MIRSRLEFGRDPEIRAEEAAPEFGNQLFARAFATILAVTAEIAIDAVSGSGPMHGLMRSDGDIGGRVAKTLDGRHLDMIERRGVERACAAVAIRTRSTTRLKRLAIVMARTPQPWRRISPGMKASRSPPAPMPSRPNSPPPTTFRTISAVGSGRRRFCFQPSQEDDMSAQIIYDHVPLGSLVCYSDGTLRPPER
jgi:hypothetical protein